MLALLLFVFAVLSYLPMCLGPGRWRRQIAPFAHHPDYPKWVRQTKDYHQFLLMGAELAAVFAIIAGAAVSVPTSPGGQYHIVAGLVAASAMALAISLAWHVAHYGYRKTRLGAFLHEDWEKARQAADKGHKVVYWEILDGKEPVFRQVDAKEFAATPGSVYSAVRKGQVRASVHTGQGSYYAGGDALFTATEAVPASEFSTRIEDAKEQIWKKATEIMQQYPSDDARVVNGLAAMLSEPVCGLWVKLLIIEIKFGYVREYKHRDLVCNK